MARTIALVNHKGGVCKTTTAEMLSSALNQKGYRVLSVDLDPQTNLSFALGVNADDTTTLYDVFKGRADTSDAVVETEAGFDLLPGSLELTTADLEFVQLGKNEMLKEALEETEDDYDFIIIDCPPALGVLTTNALTAADYAVIPVGSDVFSIQGLRQLSELIGNVRKYTNKDLKVAGLLLTKFNPRLNLSKDVREQLQNNIASQLSTKLFSTHIREAVIVKESQFLQKDIFEQGPKSTVAQDYMDFTEELLKGLE